VNDKKYDIIVYIGRFQPLHNGHANINQKISQLAKKVVVIIGSKSNPVTVKNPWSYDERVEMIQNSTHVQYMKIHGVEDYVYDDYTWIKKVTEIVESESNPDAKIAIAGYNKDESSTYLKYFPQWDLVEQPAYKVYGNLINATDIRNEIFQGKFHHVQTILPPFVATSVTLMNGTRLKYLKKEYDGILDIKQRYGTGNFVTTDAIVVQSGHVLLIKRGESGVDLWAMAGGLLEPNETFEDGVIRELREETRLKVPTKVLLGSIKHVKLFDKVDRDERGRYITQAYLFKLDDSLDLPKVKGNDDAKEAKWIPIGDFYNMRSVMYADHYHIVSKMLESL